MVAGSRRLFNVIVVVGAGSRGGGGPFPEALFVFGEAWGEASLETGHISGALKAGGVAGIGVPFPPSSYAEGKWFEVEKAKLKSGGGSKNDEAGSRSGKMSG